MASGVAMTWKAVRDVAEFAVFTLAVVTVLDLLTGGTLPSAQSAVQFRSALPRRLHLSSSRPWAEGPPQIS